MDIKTLIGNRIRQLRDQKQLSQSKLAMIANLDRTYINSIENGRRNISIVNIERLAKALDISVADFFATDEFRHNE